MRPEEYEISNEKFVLVNENKKLRDKELVTKPIGFFKDAMHRFAKNKGSIVGAVIIGLLVLYAILAPMISPYKVSDRDDYYKYALPKIFTSEKIDFLDGCKKVEQNETSFLYDYSMGVETGHNTVKRQEYTYNESTGMYTYRRDSIQKVGMIYFTSIPLKDYEAIQEYQDDTGIQVIYPITDATKRPTLTMNKSDANFWYETKVVEGKDVPANYKIKDDGTVEYTNIYKTYSNPRIISSTASNVDTAYLRLEEKGAGFAVRFYSNTKLEDGSYEKQSVGYLIVEARDNGNAALIEEDFDAASVFTFDATYSTFLTTVNGHDDPAADGEYFFSLNKERGSEANIVKSDKLTDDNYLQFKVYKNDTLVSHVDLDSEYTFKCTRSTTKSSKYFISTYNNVKGEYTNATGTSSSMQALTAAKDDGFTLQNVQPRTLSGYFNVTVSGNSHDYSYRSDDTDATVWHYDSVNNAIYTTLTGHDDSSLDGDYYVALKSDELTLSKLGDLGDGALYYPANDSGVEVSSMTIGEKYRFGVTFPSTTNNVYTLTNSFAGDNYHSHMRIEGAGEYKYDYAIKKDGFNYEIRVNYYEYYKYYHSRIVKDRISEPLFIFGANQQGQDIFSALASGARFSFILAIVVSAVNLIVGAIYGAIEGYYGGKVDMIMERVVEILSAVPFMIVITLLKYHMGGKSDVLVLFIAFFLTGWIGESGTVRMQFYRFKNQEYVLAARTLGAKDPRIMFKHIFPNALGTIITGSVLTIPGMIFSETSLSYLGIINLNSGSMTSVGTLLAGGQPYLVTFPHIILYPAIFISLLMLCFNLFGNGLRDAFNPSLRGTED